MSFTQKGKVVSIGQLQRHSDTFSKRSFVLDISNVGQNGQMYQNFAEFQAINKACDYLDTLKVGQEVTAHFDLRGNKWDKNGEIKYITNLNVWKVEVSQHQVPQQQSPPQAPQPANFVQGQFDNDLPF